MTFFEKGLIPRSMKEAMKVHACFEKNLMSARTFLKEAVPLKAMTSVPVGIHPTAHCI